ncbi:hypothetical protein [Alkalihalobacillus sp. AL-G]|uniref:hypothetical protein n=1 Tax=Alkalihalobacillus sp. AL-G TaxID=2926399 RepID=UPI00272CAA24|nr:hypothetical protein [Alkalihalobacillus sp. AL-G]WLD92523.1 hypothetical protein MOJ78_16105 [Alkalihalobacillus sp. AL-G]
MKKVLIGFVMLVVLIVIYLKIGLPWEYWSTKSAFEDHLEQYDEKMVLDEIRFDFMHGNRYHGTAYVENNPEQRFHIGELRNAQIEDGYEYEKLHRKANKEIEAIIRTYLPEYKRVGVELVGFKDRELEINVTISEVVSQQKKDKILKAIESKGYYTKQLFFQTN